MIASNVLYTQPLKIVRWDTSIEGQRSAVCNRKIEQEDMTEEFLAIVREGPLVAVEDRSQYDQPFEYNEAHSLYWHGKKPFISFQPSPWPWRSPDVY